MSSKLSSKKSKLIVLISLFVIFALSGSFLLWRVAQERELSPEYTDAGADPGDPGGDYCCRFMCCDGVWIKRNCQDDPPGPGDNLCQGVDMENICAYNGGYGDCDEDEPIVQCYCQSWDDACGTNCTFPSGVQAEVEAAAQRDCKAKVAMCKIQTGDYVIEDYTPSHPCYGKISQCNNPYAPNPCTPEIECLNCKCSPGVYTCHAPYCAGNYPYTSQNSCEQTHGVGNCQKAPDGIYECVRYDSTGAANEELCGKHTRDCWGLLHTPEPCICDCSNWPGYTEEAICNQGDSGCEVKTGICSGDCDQGTNPPLCYEYTPPPPPPSWSLSKNASRTCIDDNTPDPMAEINYSIVITNTGEGTGTLNTVVDELDSKVTNSSQVTNISNGGTFSQGTITWNLDSGVSPGSSVTLTYVVSVPKESFGTYVNSAHAIVESGNTPTATKTIDVTCNVVILTADWNIAKSGTEQCVETDAVLTYSIVVSNIGEADGQLDKVVDDLDPSISGSQISDISTGGSFSDGSIIWDLIGEQEDVAQGETKTFSYVVTIPDTDYGTYSNTATAFPREVSSLSDTVTLTAECDPPELNPEWSLSKNAVERCIDEGTEDPKAQVTYTITIDNTGEGEGTLESIVDTLDSKVLESYVSEISGGGILSDGKIIWALEGDNQKLISGEKRTFSYIVTVPSSDFGPYSNTVVANIPGDTNPQATLEIDIDCVIADPEEPVIVTYTPPDVGEIPYTGIFDDVELPLIAGLSLLILGFTWRFLGRGVYVSVSFLGKVPRRLSIHMKDMGENRRLKRDRKRKEKFEKKIIKEE